MSNSGVIGGKQTPSTSSAGGVHTAQEIHTQLTDGTFPIPYHITMTGIPSSIDEDSAFTVSVSDSSGATYSLPYILDDSTYGDAESADFQSAVTGNISMVNGAGTLVITLENDGVTENEHFHVITKHPITNVINFISGQIDITDTASSGYRYYRVNGFTPYGSKKPRLTVLRFYTAQNTAGTAYPPNMTSATAPSPYVVTRDGAYASYSEAWNAFDSSTNTRWEFPTSTNPSSSWITIDMGANVALQSVLFMWYTSTYRCTAMTLSVSTDNSTWVTKLSVSGNNQTQHYHNF
mgnify:FL=1